MIGLAVLRPVFLLLLLLVPALYVAWRLWPPPLQPGRSRLTLAARVLLVALLVFALAGIRFTTAPTKRAMVAVVDLSASVKANGNVDAEAALVRSLQAGKGADDLFGVVTFGHDAAVELPLTRDPAFESFQTQPDPQYTDIAGALRLAAGLIPDGYARHLVLISDGRQNLGDAASAVAALRGEGIRVDVVPVGQAPAAEAMVVSVDAPHELREGQAASVTVHLSSSVQNPSRLTLMVDDQEVASRDITLPAGASTQVFDLPPLDVRIHRVRAELVAQHDTYPENDVGEAAVRVLGRPAVLVLEGRDGAGANVAAALQAAGMNVDRRPAAGAPTDTTTLGRYDSTVVVDAPADSFPTDSLAAIAASVHDLGRGLVTVGGSTSYGPGGWEGTPLEQALPVRMDLPQRKDKPKVAVVLVMETMEDQRADQVVLSAAEQVIDKLTPEDLVAVTDGSGRPGFLVDMTPVSDKKAIDAKLEGGNLGDPSSYLPYMQRAVDALLRTDAPVKHIVVLGDGDAEESQPQGVQSFLQNALAKGITTSAVAVDVHGQQQYMSYMSDIARWGGGRFYQSNSPSQVPQIFLKESVASLKPWFEQDPFFPKVGSAGDLLQGVQLNNFPQLGGYVVTTPKQTADQYLISAKQDPVLAAWSYGLGRSVAWTSDSNGAWTGGFLRSPVSAALFGRMVAWTLPSGAGERLQVETQPNGDGLQVTVTGPDVAGGAVQVGVVRPDLQSSSQDLIAVAPGRWQGRISTPTVGTYLLHTVLRKDRQTLAQSDSAASVSYSPEYLELGRDEGLLQQVAKSGSGIVLARPAEAWALKLPSIPISSDVFWLMVLLAAVLWPLDIAVRRITLSPRQLVANAVALAREGRTQDLEVAVPAELARLRNRVARTRRRRVGADASTSLLSREGVEAAQAIDSDDTAGQVGRGSPGPPGPSQREEAPETEPEQRRKEEALSARLLEARRRRRGHSD